MKKIALINLSSIPILQITSVYPIGLTCLYSYLVKHGHCVDIIDFLDNEHSYYNLDFVEKNYDFIGLSIRNMELDTINGESFFNIYDEFIGEIKQKYLKIN